MTGCSCEMIAGGGGGRGCAGHTGYTRCSALCLWSSSARMGRGLSSLVASSSAGSQVYREGSGPPHRDRGLRRKYEHSSSSSYLYTSGGGAPNGYLHQNKKLFPTTNTDYKHSLLYPYRTELQLTTTCWY